MSARRFCRYRGRISTGVMDSRPARRHALAVNGMVLIVPRTRTMHHRRLLRQLRSPIDLFLLAILTIAVVAALADSDPTSDLSLLLRTMLSS